MLESEPLTPQGYEQIREAFLRNPTIEEYVRVRRKYPGVHLDTAITEGIEFAFGHQAELREYGIHPDVVIGVLDADTHAQSELALTLLGLLVERRKMEVRGETHLVSRDRSISDTLVNHLIGISLDALEWTGENEISPDLIMLIKHQLGAINSEFDARQERDTKKREAVWIAAQIAATGTVPSYRKIAKKMGVDATTVMRWFAGDDMMTKAKLLAASIQNLGALAKRTGVAGE